MIKSFSTLYAGHVIEGDGLGFEGIPANEWKCESPSGPLEPAG